MLIVRFPHFSSLVWHYSLVNVPLTDDFPSYGMALKNIQID